MMYQKVKDVAKVVLPKGEQLTAKTLKTMKTVSSIVGSTLGPGGCSVLIERQEENMPSILTKDGVTVFRHLAFEDPVMHEIMSAARDAAVRTVDAAGDGTTTATILADSIVQGIHRYIEKNPTARPQGIVRELESAFKNVVAPTLKSEAIEVNIATEEGKKLAHAVAKVSANGDTDLADAVLECFEAVGDDGSVTLVEGSGPSEYKVDIIQGYPITSGYEDSLGRFMTIFINDSANQRVYMEKVVFLLYYGAINDIQMIAPLMMKVGDAWEHDGFPHNVVVAATGFSESVLGDLAVNWQHTGAINVYPLTIPRTIEAEGTFKILQDLSAYTGATLFDPVTRPIEEAELEDFGIQMDYFEAKRTRSIIVGEGDELLILDRIDDLKVQAENAVSILDKNYIEERVGKLTGGIARLTIIGSSHGEVREKKDRAEDAVMAVRGAIKEGVLPAGGYGLIRAIQALSEKDPAPVIEEVLIPALKSPIYRLLENVGMNDQECNEVLDQLMKNVNPRSIKKGNVKMYDVWSGEFVNVFSQGLFDSLPAVYQAIQNSLSIASLLGTLGGAVVFQRDKDLEFAEARSALDFVRQANVDPDTYVSEADLRP